MIDHDPFSSVPSATFIQSCYEVKLRSWQSGSLSLIMHTLTCICAVPLHILCIVSLRSMMEVELLFCVHLVL